MSEIPFFRTQMGHRFYESTAPSLVGELARLNQNLERLLTAVEAPNGEKAAEHQVNDREPASR